VDNLTIPVYVPFFHVVQNELMWNNPKVRLFTWASVSSEARTCVTVKREYLEIAALLYSE
jgi:hypothetical protein